MLVSRGIFFEQMVRFFSTIRNIHIPCIYTPILCPYTNLRDLEKFFYVHRSIHSPFVHIPLPCSCTPLLPVQILTPGSCTSALSINPLPGYIRTPCPYTPPLSIHPPPVRISNLSICTPPLCMCPTPRYLLTEQHIVTENMLYFKKLY